MKNFHYISYIAIKLQNPKAAEDFANLYDKKVQKLCDGIAIGLPLRGKLPKRIQSCGYRWIAVKNYLAFFTVAEAEKMISIHHVTYGRRNLAKLL